MGRAGKETDDFDFEPAVRVGFAALPAAPPFDPAERALIQSAIASHESRADLRVALTRLFETAPSAWQKLLCAKELPLVESFWEALSESTWTNDLGRKPITAVSNVYSALGLREHEMESPEIDTIFAEIKASARLQLSQQLLDPKRSKDVDLSRQLSSLFSRILFRRAAKEFCSLDAGERFACFFDRPTSAAGELVPVTMLAGEIEAHYGAPALEDWPSKRELQGMLPVVFAEHPGSEADGACALAGALGARCWAYAAEQIEAPANLSTADRQLRIFTTAVRAERARETKRQQASH